MCSGIGYEFSRGQREEGREEKGERGEGDRFQNRVRERLCFCASVPFFFFLGEGEQVGEGGTCVYRLINMSLDLEIFGFRWVGLSRGMREAMIGIPCM